MITFPFFRSYSASALNVLRSALESDALSFNNSSFFALCGFLTVSDCVAFSFTASLAVYTSKSVSGRIIADSAYTGDMIVDPTITAVNNPAIHLLKLYLMRSASLLSSSLCRQNIIRKQGVSIGSTQDVKILHEMQKKRPGTSLPLVLQKILYHLSWIHISHSQIPARSARRNLPWSLLPHH